MLCLELVLPTSPTLVPAPSVSSESSFPIPSDLDLLIAFRKGRWFCCAGHPFCKFLSYTRMSPTNRTFVSFLASISAPNIVAKNIAYPGLRTAIQNKM